MGMALPDEDTSKVQLASRGINRFIYTLDTAVIWLRM